MCQRTERQSAVTLAKMSSEVRRMLADGVRNGHCSRAVGAILYRLVGHTIGAMN